MWIPRTLGETAHALSLQYPVLAITGPRQSGKTTLARRAFPDRPYVTLEDLDERRFATEDPRGFLARFPDGAILDEVQRVPDLFSYLQGVVDRDGRMGLFILTGSQRFDLLGGISQSLAGRVAMLTLLPFSLGELQDEGRGPAGLDALIFGGLYPPVHDRTLDPATWYANYIITYVERDVRQLVNVRDLSTFQRFVSLCAGRTGQLLNLSSLASDAGVSHTTARGWISVLEASYILHLVEPHHRSFNKRLVKTPVLYFLDTGLACRLLRIEHLGQLATHPLRGALFQTWLASELLKRRLHAGRPSDLRFWRDRSGHEVDFLVGPDDALVPIEAKSGATIPSDAARTLKWWGDQAGSSARQGLVVYGGTSSFERLGVRYLAWHDLPAASF